MTRHRLAHRALIAFFTTAAATGCGEPTEDLNSATPLSSELQMEPGDIEAGPPNLMEAPDPKRPLPPTLFRLTREAVLRWNGDVRDVLDRVRDIATNVPPTKVEGETRIWIQKTEDRVVRLVIEKKPLGEIAYSPEDEVPADEALREGQPPLDARLVAFRFALSVKKASEDDGLYRLAAHGHIVRLREHQIGSGAVAIRRAHVEELMGKPLGSRTSIGVRFTHRRGGHRQIARVHVEDGDGKDVRVAWSLRRLEGKAGALHMVRFGDLPGTPVSGGKPELVIIHEQWRRTDAGLVGRAHARVTAGDLGPDSVRVVECINAPEQLAFRTVILPDGQPWKPGTHGDPAACKPFDRDLAPGAPDEERLPEYGGPEQE